MWWFILIVAILATLLCFGMCRVSGDCGRAEEREELERRIAEKLRNKEEETE